MPLEERIVLDASLVSPLTNLTIDLGQTVDLRGPDLAVISFKGSPVRGYLATDPSTFTGTYTQALGNFVDTTTNQRLTANSFTAFLPNAAPANTFFFSVAQDAQATAALGAVTFTSAGTHTIVFDFVNPALTDLTLAIVNVLPPPDNNAPFVAQTFDRSGQEGTTSRQLLAKVTDQNTVSVVSGSSDNANITISNLTSEADPLVSGQYNIYGDIGFIDVASGNLSITLRDPNNNNRTFSVAVNATDAPLHEINVGPFSAQEGTSGISTLVIARFFDENPNSLASDFLVSATSLIPGDLGITLKGGLLKQADGTYALQASVDPLSYSPGAIITITVTDPHDGSSLVMFTDFSVTDAPLSLVSSSPITAVEGSVSSPIHQLAVFHDGNGFSEASGFKASLNGLINGDNVSSWSIVKDGNGDYVVSAAILLSPDNDAGSYPLSLTIQDIISGQNLIVPISYDITNAPWSLGGALSVDALAGAPFVGKIGSFVDSNPNENIANYQVIVDSDLNAAGNQGSGYLVQTGLGAYDVYGQLTYNASGSQAGTFTIMDMSNFGAPNPSETLVGSFNANVRAGQLLWGVDQSNGQLFSVGDYSLPGAEGRVNLYGQLHTAAGVIIGNDIQAFTIDGADANGRNAAFVAISKSVGGINTFSIGVIADINDPAHRTEVTLYKISGMNFNLLKDNITGLAIDPNSGNILGVVVRDNAPATLFVIDKNTLSSADHIAKAYTLGKIIGTDDLGGQKVTNARDLAFDSAGNLFVTDGAKDKLYQISAANGEILAVSNMNEDNGLGEANIEALAWDPVLGKLIGANSILNAGLPANDLVGLSTANGPNAIDVHLLQSLKDVEGMAFMPKFGLRSGDNLGVLIDTGRTEVDYRAGQGPVLLLHDVELISFGEDTYDNGSLTVDVSGVDIGEFFAIKAGDGIAIDAAGNIRYKGLFFGTIDALENGKNGKALTIHFNANASEKAVEHLMERITYLNKDSALILVDKVIAFTIKDSLGAVIGYTTINLDIESRTSSQC